MSAEVIPFPAPRPKPVLVPAEEESLLVRLERVLAKLKAQQGETA